MSVPGSTLPDLGVPCCGAVPLYNNSSTTKRLNPTAANPSVTIGYVKTRRDSGLLEQSDGQRTMETAPHSSAAPGRSPVALDCPGHSRGIRVGVEIRSMPKSLFESRHRTAGALSGHALVAWLGAVSTFRSRSPHAGSESRLYHFDSAIFADFA